jgi:hypothetical protein
MEAWAGQTTVKERQALPETGVSEAPEDMALSTAAAVEVADTTAVAAVARTKIPAALMPAAVAVVPHTPTQG